MGLKKKINTLKYIETFLKIRTKDAKLEPLILNEPQMRLYNTIKKLALEGKPIRIIILKARQMGFSTATGGIIFKNTATKHFIQSAIITHKESTTTQLFEMYKRYLNYLPDEMKPQVMASNAKELIFNSKVPGQGLDSKIKCMTATDEGVGRGDTNQNVHMSEYAFWKNPTEVYSSLMQSVPNTPDSMVIIESTANGYNDFKKKWDDAVAGETDFTPLFFAWHEMKTYRMKYTGFPLTSEEIELKHRYHLDNEQLTWRRWCIRNNCNNDIDKFKQEYPACPEEAFLFSGNSYFSMESLKRAKELAPKVLKRGFYSYELDSNLKPINIKWVDSDDGIIRIYERPNPVEPYVLGGDTAGEGSDAFICQVLDNITANQVAVLEYKGADEIFYAQQTYCLGKAYNFALLAIETNFSTYPQRKMEEWEYPKMFVREALDTFTHKPKASYGFRTDIVSRPLILANLQSLVRDNYTCVKDYQTITEMETFVKNEKGKPEAMEGCHDDHVMALAIALYARNQQDFKQFEFEEIKEPSNIPFALRTDTDDYQDDGGYLW